MAQPEEPGRRRGNIRQRGNSLQVRFFAGKDPVTGRDVYLTASISGTDRKAHKRAEDKLAEFRTQVNKQRSTPSSVKLGYAIAEWLRTSEHEDSTREGTAVTSRGQFGLRSATCRSPRSLPGCWRPSTPTYGAAASVVTGGRSSSISR